MDELGCLWFWWLRAGALGCLARTQWISLSVPSLFPQNLLWGAGSSQKPSDKNSGHSHRVVVPLGSSLICSIVSLIPISHPGVTTSNYIV